MKKKHRIYFNILFALSCFKNIVAQEQLMPISGNVELQQAKQSSLSTLKTSSITGLDTLPFFDDFSYSFQSAYATPNHWIDSSVYINSTFAVAPISLGVATFDGLNHKGYPYNLYAATNSSGQADFLTSRPINIQKKGNKVYGINDSIYFSFYYQAMGRGDWPESIDSLSLDFYKPNQNKWVKVWGKAGYKPMGADTGFHRVMIAIKDTAYLDSLFQFRFRNRATLSGSLDHWNIDYVYFNSGRGINDTLFQDVTFAYMSNPFLKNYSKMPYSQYITSEFAPNFNNWLRNNDKVASNITYYYDVYNQTNALKHSYSAVDNILPFENNGYQTGVSQFAVSTGTFVQPPLTDTVLKIKHYIKTSSSDFTKINDTLIQYQNFPNYYAYDDGSAEVGYYNNTFGAKVAVRYTINKPDTLRAINIYFDPITQGGIITGSSFRLMVWGDGGGSPTTIPILKDSLVYPLYLQGKHNKMPTYALTTCMPITPGTYYFGIQQSSNQPLNIGFDKNTNHSSALFYDIGNGWTNSTIKGSLMINPVMGCYVPPPPVGVKEFTKQEQLSFNLFPNPANNEITINYRNSNNSSRLLIHSVVGNELLNTVINNNETIDINSLSSGVYVVTLISNGLSSTQKLVISK